MSLDALSALAPQDEVPGALAAPLPTAPAAADAPAFGDMIARGLEALNTQLHTSQVDLQQLALGQARSLHEVMTRLEQSRIGLQLMMQVRARLLEGYQDLMRTPI